MLKNLKVLGVKSATAVGLALVSLPAYAADSEGVTQTKAAMTAGYTDLTSIVIAGITAACALAAIVFGGMWVRGLLAGRTR